MLICSSQVVRFKGKCEPMPKREFTSWMWFEAVDRLSRAQRLHQQFFTLNEHGSGPSWEPPADVLETETEVLIFFALPGVDPESVDAVIEGGTLVVSGRRVLPEELRTALIHQLELPQGRFARRVPLPPSRYDGVKRQAINGCLLISLHKSAS
jgi:HSP20 family protein